MLRRQRRPHHGHHYQSNSCCDEPEPCGCKSNCHGNKFDCGCQPQIPSCGSLISNDCCNYTRPPSQPSCPPPKSCAPANPCSGGVHIGCTPDRPPKTCCNSLNNPFSRPLGSYGSMEGCYYDSSTGMILPEVNDEGLPIAEYSFTSNIINEGIQEGVISNSLIVGGIYTYEVRYGSSIQEVLDSEWQELPTADEVQFQYLQHRIQVVT